jgi:hypothetical protein
MKGQIFRLLFLFLIVNCFVSCHSIRPVAPPHVSEIPELNLKPSSINVPVVIDMKDLEAKINKEFNGLVYENNNLEGNQLSTGNYQRIMVKAWKKDDFSIALIGNRISYRLPLKLWVKADFKFEKFGITLSDDREFDGDIALKFNTVFTIRKDWTLITKTSFDGYEWLSSPTLDIAGLKIPITYIADIFLRASKNMITRRIDDTIKTGISIRKHVEDAWYMLQKPIKINDQHNIWLKIYPSSVSAIPVNGVNNKIYLSAAINSVNKLIIGKEPVDSLTTSLPDLNIVNKLEPLFEINLNTEIPFSKINELAQKELTDKEFTQGNNKIIIKDINAYGSKDRFIVELNVDGSINGKIYLRGKPEYNSLTKSIEVKDLDFDLKTRNALVKTASWILHGTFINMIAPKLRYSIALQLELSKSMLQKYLTNNNSIKGMILNGEINKIDIDRIFVSEDAVLITVYLKGSLSVNVNNLSGM